jgi:hypothetical protein
MTEHESGACCANHLCIHSIVHGYDKCTVTTTATAPSATTAAASTSFSSISTTSTAANSTGRRRKQRSSRTSVSSSIGLFPHQTPLLCKPIPSASIPTTTTITKATDKPLAVTDDTTISYNQQQYRLGDGVIVESNDSNKRILGIIREFSSSLLVDGSQDPVPAFLATWLMTVDEEKWRELIMESKDLEDTEQSTIQVSGYRPGLQDYYPIPVTRILRRVRVELMLQQVSVTSVKQKRMLLVQQQPGTPIESAQDVNDASQAELIAAKSLLQVGRDVIVQPKQLTE